MKHVKLSATDAVPAARSFETESRVICSCISRPPDVRARSDAVSDRTWCELQPARRQPSILYSRTQTPYFTAEAEVSLGVLAIERDSVSTYSRSYKHKRERLGLPGPPAIRGEREASAQAQRAAPGTRLEGGKTMATVRDRVLETAVSSQPASFSGFQAAPYGG